MEMISNTNRQKVKFNETCTVLELVCMSTWRISCHTTITKKDKLHSDAIDLGYKIISEVINVMACITSSNAHKINSCTFDGSYCVLAYYISSHKILKMH